MTQATGPPLDLVPPPTAAAWTQGESRLYALALAGPDAYERALHLVGRTLDDLRQLGSGTAALLAASAQGAGLVARAAPDDRRGGLDLDLVARAALAARHREVVAEQAALDRLRALQAARVRGDAWVVLAERGEAVGDPYLPYSRLEAEAVTGRALLVTATADEQFRSCVHAVEQVHVDLVTGEVRDDAGTRAEHGSATQREACAAGLRQQPHGPSWGLARDTARSG